MHHNQSWTYLPSLSVLFLVLLNIIGFKMDCTSFKPLSSPSSYGFCTSLFHKAQFLHGSTLRNRKRLYKSSKLFWIGVPVRHQRRSAVRAAAAKDIKLLEDFIRCASSSTTLNQCTEYKAPCSVEPSIENSDDTTPYVVRTISLWPIKLASFGRFCP